MEEKKFNKKFLASLTTNYERFSKNVFFGIISFLKSHEYEDKKNSYGKNFNFYPFVVAHVRHHFYRSYLDNEDEEDDEEENYLKETHYLNKIIRLSLIENEQKFNWLYQTKDYSGETFEEFKNRKIGVKNE